MPPTPPTHPILPRNLTLPINPILINQQTLQPHRAPGMDLIGADADLGAEAEAHAVRHAGARIPKDAGGVDGILELAGDGGGGREDGVGVVGGVGVDVGGGEGAGCAGGGRARARAWEGRDGFDGEDGGEEFGRIVFLRCVLEGGGLGFREGGREGGFGLSVAAEGDALVQQCGCDGWEDGLQGGFVHEQGLDRVACCRVAQFCVQEDLDGHVWVGVLVDVNAAEAVGVAEDGDPGVVLDVSD